MGELERLTSKGESQKLELKRSTAELREALQSVCAFLNGDGGKVIIGARPEGTVIGQLLRASGANQYREDSDGIGP